MNERDTLIFLLSLAKKTKKEEAVALARPLEETRRMQKQKDNYSINVGNTSVFSVTKSLRKRERRGRERVKRFFFLTFHFFRNSRSGLSNPGAAPSGTPSDRTSAKPCLGSSRIDTKSSGLILSVVRLHDNRGLHFRCHPP